MKNSITYSTKEELLSIAQSYVGTTLRSIIEESESDYVSVVDGVKEQGNRRKGYFGDLVEEYLFGLTINNSSTPDFLDVNVELKTTPIKKHAKLKFISKERLVFSMINYNEIVNEDWKSSSFLRKNASLLIIFYLWEKELDLLDYKIKFAHLLELLSDISNDDIYQIQSDWEYIVSKIKRGDAHLLSEGDTFILGACTKAANSTVRRSQPFSEVDAKPRAFSFKQPYLNFLIQTKLLGRDLGFDSIKTKSSKRLTIEEIVLNKFTTFIGKTGSEIKSNVGWDIKKTPKNWKRLLANRMLGTKSNKIEELEKANITLKAITLEHTGNLKESISFPSFDYIDLIQQTWFNGETGEICDFHQQLDAMKFLFVVFQKVKNSEEIFLKKVMFWNFPASDLGEVERVWRETVRCIQQDDYGSLPKIKDSPVSHVRPHGKDGKDTLVTPQRTKEIKRSFWLNAKYIQKAIEQ